MTSEMQEVLLYLSAFFMVFLSFVVFSFCLRVIIWIYMEYWCPQRDVRHQQRSADGGRNGGRVTSRIHQRDRQGNIFTIADDTTHNSGTHQYADFFYIEPSVEDAARIRAQLDKDDKDLPSYDEVMGMTNLTVASPANLVVGVSTTSIATTDTMLTVPPYSEVDPHAPTTINATTDTMTNVAPAQLQQTATASTSRAAVSSITIPIINSASNSNV